MREATEHALRHLLERHDRAVLRSAGSDTDRALRMQDFDRRFQERVKHTVEPVMANARALMHDHGVHSEIVVAQRRSEPDGKVTPSSITFEFRVLTDAEVEGFPLTIPSLAFIADPVGDAVLVQENSILPFAGGYVGVVARASIDELTGEYVEDQLLRVAQKVLSDSTAS